MICSAARSGSTLFDRLLGAHPKAASLGEITFLGQAITMKQDCSCGKLVIECESWKAVFDYIEAEKKINLRTHPYALQLWDARSSVNPDTNFQTPLYYLVTKIRTLLCDIRFSKRANNSLRLPLPKQLQHGVENSLFLFELIARVWEKDLLIDSSKSIHKTIATYEKCPDQVRAIYLTRDGRGVYNSRRSSGFSRRDAATHWFKYNKRALAYLSSNIHKEHLLQIKYEDLVGEPEKNLDKICTFLNIDYDPSMLKYAEAEHHLMAGNDMRFSNNQQLKLDERWKSNLSDSELSYFLTTAGSMNQQLGYF